MATFIKYSKDKVWWFAGNENKPSIKFFEEFKSKMIDAPIGFGLNFIDYQTVSFVNATDEITYIWVHHNDRDFYYVVGDIIKTLAGAYEFQLMLDNFTTFTLPFLKSLSDEDKQVKVLRSHKWDKNTILYNDDLMDTIPLISDSKRFVRTVYSEKDGVYESLDGKYRIKYQDKDDAINGVKYYVFKFGPNNSYTLIPVLSHKKNPQISRLQTIEGSKTKYGFSYITGFVKDPTSKEFVWDGSNWKEFSGSLNSVVQEAINNNWPIEYRYGKTASSGTGGISEEVKISTSQGTLPNKLVWTMKRTGNNTWLNAKLNYQGSTLADQERHFVTAIREPSAEGTWDLSLTQTYVYITNPGSGGKPVWQPYEDINNTEGALEEFKLSSEWSNHFLGVYYLPNILNFGDKWVKKDYNIHVPTGEVGGDGKLIYKTVKYNLLVIQPDPRGMNLAPFKIMDAYPLQELKQFNQPTISNINQLKYLNVRYYNNLLDPALRLNENNEVWLSGYFTFGTNGVLVDKPQYLDITSSTISWPYQLPSGTDAYLQYVGATMNTVNTGMQIAKEQMIASVVGGIAGIGLSAASLGTFGRQWSDYNYNNNLWSQEYTEQMNIFNSYKYKGSNGAQSALSNAEYALGQVGQSLSGSFGAQLGTFGSAGGVLSGIFSTINAGLAYKNKISMNKATYADKRKQLGTQINISQTQDLAWSWYLDLSLQYEGVEIQELSEESIKQLNNVLYLYGNMNIETSNINDFLNVDFNGFRYVLFDEEYITNLIPINTPNWYPKIVWAAIATELAGGVRIWDKEPIYE